MRDKREVLIARKHAIIEKLNNAETEEWEYIEFLWSLLMPIERKLNRLSQTYPNISQNRSEDTVSVS